MEERDLQNQIIALKDKLNRAMRRSEGLKEKSKCLESQYSDAREREKRTSDLVMELIERQRELNVMLNRANIMLSRTQEALALTSTEFNEVVKALPEPKKAEWSDRVAKINELFMKTGFQEAETSQIESTESERTFEQKDSIWTRPESLKPERVEAVLVEDDSDRCPVSGSRDTVVFARDDGDDRCASEEEPFIKARKKSWWQGLIDN